MRRKLTSLAILVLCLMSCGCATERRRGYWDSKGFHELRSVRIPADADV